MKTWALIITTTLISVLITLLFAWHSEKTTSKHKRTLIRHNDELKKLAATTSHHSTAIINLEQQAYRVEEIKE